MTYKYAVVGAGRQGIAAAYDLARFGEAEEILLIDADATTGQVATNRLNSLLPTPLVTWHHLNVTNTPKLTAALHGVTTLISAVPYMFNLNLTRLAIQLGINMCDMGGNTHIVRQQLAQDKQAKQSGITLVPDCGMGPGMNISLATYAMSLMDTPAEVYIWDGGLPQNPAPPWKYSLTFNIGGLTNEYYGNAYFLRNGKIVEVPCFEGYEQIDFPPVGVLEAFVTSGGLSTMPWTFQGKLKHLENKTLRYVGHCAQFKAFADLGLLDLNPLDVDGTPVVPRMVFHKLLESRIYQPIIQDIALMRVTCRGVQDGVPTEATIELVDYYDETTGFMAMQRLTGWHTSILAILATQGKLPRGAIPVERAVDGETVVKEAERRGFSIHENVTALE